ncbi:cupin domain-containing protein [Aquimarina brevivitae]|uniref:DUF985 domain-containing protein n=1 Tax=Aquimarina brevivitae TaxID=323412 RepID=A0A4Q7PI84_9FLAO|nr:cupin domain-containing protein [Aquimarina brevivitae]RZT00322.1 hypothetical protein EV197_1558 [Aquimarina brevivitae]
MKTQDRIDELTTGLGLLPHPEGGFYKETHRSPIKIKKKNLPDTFSGDRNCSTAIYFLLTSDNFSAFHRIQQDEVWHYYEGSPLDVHVIDKEGAYTKYEVGLDLRNGAVPQLVVPAGVWFASSVRNEDDYSFVGCTVSPGFDFDDFELADRKALSLRYPEHRKIISRLTR